MTILAATGAVASVIRAAQEAYGTSSWSDFIDAARSVSPVGRPGLALVSLAALWLGAVLVAVAGMVRMAPRVDRRPPALPSEPVG